VSKLDELVQSISTMTDDELLERIRTVRRDRKISKQPIKTRSTATARVKRKESVIAILDSLSREERDKLLKGLK
jgi:hypothetical protein